jgi:predicted dehydrogenase
MNGPAVLGDKPLRIGFAGAGAISVYHLAGWKQTENIEVVAVCDPIREKAEARAREFAIRRVYTDFAEMLDAEQPDAVDIATPVATHAPLTRLAADRAIHVMCQKPMTPTVAEAEALVEYVGDRVRFMVHENFRFRPHYVEVKHWLVEGRLGQVQHARMIVRGESMVSTAGGTPPLLKRQPYLQSFPRLLIFEALIHHLDTLRCLLGPISVEWARVDKVNASLAGEDVALIALRSARGATVVVDGNISAAGYPPMPVDRLEIIGSRGTLILDVDRLYLVGKESAAIHVDVTKNYQACFTAAIRHFVAGLRTGAPFQTDRLDNLETLRLMESAYIAAGVKG